VSEGEGRGDIDLSAERSRRILARSRSPAALYRMALAFVQSAILKRGPQFAVMAPPQ
jgi:hypothetical protein